MPTIPCEIRVYVNSCNGASCSPCNIVLIYLIRRAGPDLRKNYTDRECAIMPNYQRAVGWGEERGQQNRFEFDNFGE